MDREEYFCYTLDTPSEYQERYGRRIEDIHYTEVRLAMMQYDRELEQERDRRQVVIRTGRRAGRVAQLEEQRSSKPKDEGSIPSTPTKDRIETLLIDDE